MIITRRHCAALNKFWAWYDILTGFSWALTDWIIPSLITVNSPFGYITTFMTGPAGVMLLFTASVAFAAYIAHQNYYKTDEKLLAALDKPAKPMSAKGLLKLTATVLFAEWLMLTWLLPSTLPTIITPLCGIPAITVVNALTGGVGTLMVLGVTALIVAGFAVYCYWNYQQEQNRPIASFASIYNKPQEPSTTAAPKNSVTAPQVSLDQNVNQHSWRIDNLFSCLRPWSCKKPANEPEPEKNFRLKGFSL